MRPRSLIGPILLILIGAAFLVRNIWPEIPLLSLLSDYWPFLLIGWGLLRLMEVVFWALQSKPLPRAGISGAEWALAIVICIVGGGSEAVRDRWPRVQIGGRGVEVFGQPWDFEVNATHPLGDARRIVVENPRGNVRVTGGGDGEVRIGGRTTVRAFRKEDAVRAHRDSPLEVVADGDRLVIRNKQNRRKGPWRITSDLEINVPKQVSVEGRGEFGDFDIVNVSGDVDVQSDNAAVRMADIGGRVQVKLNRSDVVRAVNVGGGVKLDSRAGEDVELAGIRGPVVVSGSYSGSLLLRELAGSLVFDSPRTEFRAGAVPGEVRVNLSQLTGVNVIGPIKVKTRSRDVDLADFTEKLDLELERGRLDLRPGRTPLAKMDLAVKSADVQLMLPESAAFGLLLQVEKGSLVNEYGAALTQESRDDRQVLKGPPGRDPTIRLRADRGTVTVAKAGAVVAEAPLAPHPPIPPKPPQVEQY
ncbi:MAG: DUF4097 family beta strand repeat protein [Bryobacteraceae bacterium]|nr:DUF4097 family beta strand repeat protein [Bryobacteraceae bacterium]